MFHVNAWGAPYAGAMCGAKLVLPGPLLDGESVYELMRDEGVTLALGVFPAQVLELANRLLPAAAPQVQPATSVRRGETDPAFVLAQPQAGEPSNERT